MKKWIVVVLMCVFSGSAWAKNVEYFDERKRDENPAYIPYYKKYINQPGTKEYERLMVSLRATANGVDFYTRTLDKADRQIDYCLPTLNGDLKQILSMDWSTPDLIGVINRELARYPHKYQRAQYGISTLLVNALRSEYPCPGSKQRRL
ncbi:hypothetical protein [Enterovibrio norvegicus]|uniref:Rap1a immunity protein domain-containing protein n=1 Tax=Enterovibrio norvegicus TaxID=188144 RepID=A0ABV4L538_9GAMM